MLHDLFAWIQNDFGVGVTRNARSFSGALDQSLNFWGILEGTHLLMLMVFFGTIMIVDLRLMGVHLKGAPVSAVSDRLLPFTVVSMGIVVATGIALFFSEPLLYYHNLWFRLKMVLFAAAVVNIGVFYTLIEKNRTAWDSAPTPPAKARAAAAISLASWVLIIGCGRMIGYNFVECGKPLPAWLNAAQECAVSDAGAVGPEDPDQPAAGPPAGALPSPAPAGGGK